MIYKESPFSLNISEIKTAFFSILSYGCQMNAHDAEQLSLRLIRLGYKETQDLAQASIIIINTCCVRESAEKKIYGKIGELLRYKTNNPNLVIGISGCLAQKDREKLFRKAPHIDFILGTHNIGNLENIIQSIQEKKEKVISITESGENEILTPAIDTQNRLNAWIPIMYGCNNFCTYCIVPYVRGREHSRNPEEILSDIRTLGKQGVKEITLLGQNVNSYGKDIPALPSFGELLNLIDRDAAVARIRYMTSHPRDMDSSVIHAIQSGQRICEHFHLPIQSGSDSVLQRMNRGYTTDYYRKLVFEIRQTIPNTSLTTDIIVGFPGETDAEFQETLDFIKEICFDAAYTFIYSKRSGTPAAEMNDQIPLAIKKLRLQQLMDVQNEISVAINKALLHTTWEVLVEGPSKNNPKVWTGRTRTNKIVLWDASGYEEIGDLVQVRITQAQTWTLKGVIIT